MIGFSELAVLMAAVGFIMLVASVFVKGYEAQLKSVGGLLLVGGIALYFLLYIFG